MVKQQSGRISVGVVGLAVIASGLPAAAHASSARLSAPRQVAVGQAALVRLDALGARGLAAQQAVMRFDHGLAELAGVRQLRNGVSARGRHVEALGPIRRGATETFGFFSCAASQACGFGAAGHASRPASRRLRLATLELHAKRPGILRISLVRVLRVSASGARAATTRAVRSVTVRIVPAGADATAGRGAVRSAFGPARTLRPARRLDLTGNRLVDAGDTADVALAWRTAREAGAACAGGLRRPDLNGDGCVDAADAQLVAARASRRDALAALRRAHASAPLRFAVNSTADGSDAAINGVCRTAAGACTLRAAIQEANAHAGPDTVAFAIPGAGTHRIQLASALPALSDTSGATTIDGLTQPGSALNTAPQASNAVIHVEIAGTGPAGIDCLRIVSPGNVVKDLAVFNCHRAILLQGSGARSNSIRGNHVGTNAAGTFISPSSVVGASGVELHQGASLNRIGDTSAGARNVLSGNGAHGVATYDQGTNGNLVLNNIIGLSPLGDRRLQNWRHGIDLNSGSSNNQIGGTAAFQRNVISGNGLASATDNFTAGVEISHSTTTVGNRVVGNFFGTNLAGSAAPVYAHNSHYGIRLEDGVNNIDIASNVIGNSRRGGIRVDSPLTTNVRITNNRIGISTTGAAIPNQFFGIEIMIGAHGIRTGPGNTIAFNPVGIHIGNAATDHDTITRNAIFSNTGLGIDLEPWGSVNPNDAGDADSGANQQLNFPVLRTARTTAVTGTACAGCTVEVFLADGGATANGEGKRFLASAVARADGTFSAVVSGIAVGQFVTATATDGAGDTSEFARNLRVS